MHLSIYPFKIPGIEISKYLQTIISESLATTKILMRYYSWNIVCYLCCLVQWHGRSW